MRTSIVALLSIIHLVVSAPIESPTSGDTVKTANFGVLQNEIQALNETIQNMASQMDIFNATLQSILVQISCKFHFSTYNS
jgi:hypothetical protein